MKKYLILILGVILFNSCSSNDSETITETDLLVGKWKAIQTGTVVNGEEILSDTEDAPCNLEYHIEFLTDGHCQSQGCNPYTTPPQIHPMRSGTYIVSIINNVKTVTFNYPSEDRLNGTYTIKELNHQKLKLYVVTDFGSLAIGVYQRL